MTDFGDRMKLYEGLADQQLMPLAPVCARIDGRAFHSFTKGLDEPFDDAFRQVMIKTTIAMVALSGARVGHTFSDEINLVFLQEDFKSEIFFGGRHQKMVSVLASEATIHFFVGMLANMPMFMDSKRQHRFPTFDCRVWNVPNIAEAANYLLWREQDAVRNSVQMAARSVYSHNECHKKNGSDLQEMLHQKGINWNNYPSMHKRGVYVRRIKTKRKFTQDELQRLPPKHAAHENQNMEIERTDVVAVEMPILTQLEHHQRIEHLFLNPNVPVA